MDSWHCCGNFVDFIGRKRRNREESDDSVNNGYTPKAGKYSDSPEGVCVSSVLSQTNTVLFEDFEWDCAFTLETYFDMISENCA